MTIEAERIRYPLFNGSGGDKVGLTSLEMESTDGRFTLVAHTRKSLLDVVDEVCALL